MYAEEVSYSRTWLDSHVRISEFRVPELRFTTSWKNYRWRPLWIGLHMFNIKEKARKHAVWPNFSKHQILCTVLIITAAFMFC